MGDNGFFVAPNEVFADHSLSLIQVRVLLALYSFRHGRSTNLVWPSREKLSARCGYSPATVSRATADLVRLGWLKKTGKGGRSMSVRYEILDAQEPKTVTDPGMVLPPVNGDRSGQGLTPKTVTDPGTKTVTDPVTRIEETKEETKSSSSRARVNLRKVLSSVCKADGTAQWRVERFASPRVVQMLDVWVADGVTAEDVRAVVGLVRLRGVDPGSPCYLEGPMRDYLREKSGQARVQRESCRVPRDDDAMVAWAKRQGFSSARTGESYREYRARLQGELDRRQSGHGARPAVEFLPTAGVLQ